MSSATGRRRLTQEIEYEVPVREPRLDSPELARGFVRASIVLGVVATFGCLTSVVHVPGAPEWIQRPAAALLLFDLGFALTSRVGGHLRIWLPIIGAIALSALLLQTTGLIASAAGLTAVLAAVLAIMGTRPATTSVEVLRELAVAVSIAVAGMAGVAAWNAHVQPERFGLLVSAGSLGLAIATVWGLGAGLHGLQRVHLSILVGIAVVLIAVVGYAALVRTHGSPLLVESMGNTVLWLRRTIGGIPRPVEVLIGYPALIVGVSLRSRRREGWWIEVFAVLGTALGTASLVSPDAFPSYITLSLLYSGLLGTVVGFVIRHFVAGSSRSSRAIQQPLRIEPGRFEGLK